MYKANTNSLILNNPCGSNLTERKKGNRPGPSHTMATVEGACEDGSSDAREEVLASPAALLRVSILTSFR
jgi:hypothetical protein